MRRFLLLTFLLGAPVLAAPVPTPTCTVKAVSVTQWWRPGRLVTVTPIHCPPGGQAFVRFRSTTGSQPDAPPGHFVLKAGQALTRRVPAGWWVDVRSRLLQWSRVPFTPQGGKT